MIDAINAFLKDHPTLIDSIWTTVQKLAIGGLLWSFILAHLKRRSDKKKTAALVYLFAVESTKLFERFAQYVEQILIDRKLSKSRPFELLPASEMSQLVERGVDPSVLEAIFLIRELSSLVTLQVDHAHAAVREPAYPRTINGRELSIWPAQRDFDRIHSFVSSGDYKVIESVESLMRDAEKRRGAKAVVALRAQFEKDKKKIQDAEAGKAKDGLFIGERKELPT